MLESLQKICGTTETVMQYQICGSPAVTFFQVTPSLSTKRCFELPRPGWWDLGPPRMVDILEKQAILRETEGTFLIKFVYSPEDGMEAVLINSVN